MKRSWKALLLALAVSASLALPAFADVLWEPYGDSFYDSHQGECTVEGRNYLANGAEGYVAMVTSPEDSTPVMYLPNGETLTIAFLWTAEDGARWGVADYGVDDGNGTVEWYSGWLSLAELAQLYDATAFAEDHGQEFAAYDGSGDAITTLAYYDYPGGRCQGQLEQDEEYQPFSQAFQNLYTDESGLRWSQIGYYMGVRSIWVCLDDPTNQSLGTDAPRTISQVRGTGETLNPGSTTLPSDTVPPQTLIPPAEDIPTVSATPSWLIPAVLVALAAVITALAVGLRRKKSTQDGE